MTSRELLLAIQSLVLALVAILLLSREVVEKEDRLPPVFQAIALAGCLFAGVLFTNLLGMERLLLAFSISIGIFLSILRPVNATCLFIALYFLRPWEVMEPNDLITSFPKTVAVIAIGRLLIEWLRLGRIDLFGGKGAILMFLFTVWMFFSTVRSGDPATSLRLFFDNLAKAAIVFFLILNAIRTLGDRSVVYGTLVLSVLGVGAMALVFVTENPLLSNSESRLQTVGMFSNANDIASLMTMAVPLVLLPFVRSKSILIKLASLACLIALGIVIYQSQSRGAVLAISAILLVMAGTKLRLGLRTKVIAAAICCVVVVLGSSFGRGKSDLEGSTTSRLNYWKAAGRMALYNPVLGVGYGRFGRNYEKYAVSFEYEWGSRTAHSTWLLVLAEGGWLAFAFLIGLFLNVLWCAYTARDQYPELFYAVIGYGVAMSFLSHSYTIYPYILFAIVLASARMAFTKSAAAVTSVLIALAGLTLSSSSSAVAAGLGAVAGAEKPLGKAYPATRESLVLKGSRGETLNFILKLDSAVARDKRLKVNAPAGTTIQLYTMPTIKTRKPSFAGAFVGEHYDPLIPYSDDQLLQSSEQVPLWVFGELSIPTSESAGVRSGSIELMDSTGTVSERLPITLSIWKMILSEDPALPAYFGLSTFEVLIGHFGAWQPGEGALTRLYVDALHAHRIAPLKASVTAPPVMPPVVSDDPLKARPPLLDLNAGSAPGESYRSLRMDSAPGWSYLDFPWPGANAESAKLESWWKALENTIQEEKLQNRSMIYLWDEPQSFELDRMARMGALAKKHAPSLKVMATTRYFPELESGIDIFCPLMRSFERGELPNPVVYDRLKKKGKELWWYVSCTSHGCGELNDDRTPDFVLDRPSSYVRSIAWLSMVHGVQAFLYYNATDAYFKMPKVDPWQDLEAFGGNGDGTLFYPGRPGIHGLKEHGPIASIRLKLWREASFDAEYIRWMNALEAPPEWFKPRLASLIQSPRGWSRDYSAYQKLRDEIGEYLNARN